MRKNPIMGVTVGTTISPKKVEEKIKPVKTVNGKGPDENGNVKVEGGNGYSIYVSTEQHPEIGYDVITGMDDSYIETNGRAIQVNDLIIMGRYLYRVTVINDTSFDAELSNDVDFLTNKELLSAIDAALTEAKQSGMFDGAPGAPGANGKTPYIQNGYWYINGVNTNVKAEGVDGKGIKSFAKTIGNGAAGTTDTYTVTFTDNTKFELTVYNGKDGKDATANFGVCSTAAGTAAKVVNVDGFELKTGEVVTVKFAATNSAANPTLNVNSTGAYPIIYKGNSVAAYTVFGVGALEADKLYQFVFTGSNYELVGGLHIDRMAGANAGYAKSGGDIDFNGGVGTLKDGVVPVKSVNGKTGDVTLDAGDVGARPDTWTPSYSEVGADKNGAASSAVSGHNTNASAHNDIRLLIEGISTRLNALANSTDEDLDQMAELVAYIKANKALIDSITTTKVNVSDIVNNLTSNVTNKPLSAAQGVALKALIDAITVPTNVSAFNNDAGYLKNTDLAAKADPWTITFEDGSTATKKVVLA